MQKSCKYQRKCENQKKIKNRIKVKSEPLLTYKKTKTNACCLSLLPVSNKKTQTPKNVPNRNPRLAKLPPRTPPKREAKTRLKGRKTASTASPSGSSAFLRSSPSASPGPCRSSSRPFCRSKASKRRDGLGRCVFCAFRAVGGGITTSGLIHRNPPSGFVC